MFWIGTKTKIDAANALATAAVVTPDDPITTTWAVPRQDATGKWVIPAYPPMETPEGCTAVETVVWPEAEE